MLCRDGLRLAPCSPVIRNQASPALLWDGPVTRMKQSEMAMAGVIQIRRLRGSGDVDLRKRDTPVLTCYLHFIFLIPWILDPFALRTVTSHLPVIPFSLMLYIILVSRMMANDNLHAFSSYTLCYTRSVMYVLSLMFSALDLLFRREALKNVVRCAVTSVVAIVHFSYVHDRGTVRWYGGECFVLFGSAYYNSPCLQLSFFRVFYFQRP